MKCFTERSGNLHLYLNNSVSYHDKSVVPTPKVVPSSPWNRDTGKVSRNAINTIISSSLENYLKVVGGTCE